MINERWDKLGIPHKGWQYCDVEHVDEDETCQMCGKEAIRYVHLLRHPEYNELIRVGCICASKMVDGYIDPKARERKLKNRLEREKTFLKKAWYTKRETGNIWTRYKGEIITIQKSKYGNGYIVLYRKKVKTKYKGKQINDIETAKKAAFDLYEEIIANYYE